MVLVSATHAEAVVAVADQVHKVVKMSLMIEVKLSLAEEMVNQSA